MKVTYTNAVIGFCWDLTDAEAKSLPVAVLVVGTAENMAFAAVSSIAPSSPEDVDPISFDVLSDVPGLLKDHVAAALRTLDAGVPVEKLLTTLHARLRNSLHVASIGEPESAEVDVSAMPAETLPEHIAQMLLDRAKAVHHGLLHDAGVTPLVPQRPLARTMPAMSVWPLPRPAPGRAVARLRPR